MSLFPRPKGLIFDCDGTLADTMPLHWQAWQVITARHRIHLPQERFYSLGGVPSREILKLLSAEQGLGLDHLAVALEKEAEYLPLIAQVEPINVVVGIVREHHGNSAGQSVLRTESHSNQNSALVRDDAANESAARGRRE